MGKVQSKPGECYVFDARLNPVDSRKSQKMPLTSSPSKLCSELSLSLCHIDECKAPDKHPLKGRLLQVLKIVFMNCLVYLPPKDSSERDQAEDTHPEKAEEEKSEKEQRKNNLKEAQSESSEFTFTLYDFNGSGKISKDDVERVVGRTLSEALERSLNFSSSNHTIQVHLAITPEKNSKHTLKNDSVQKEEITKNKDKTSQKSRYYDANSAHPLFSPGKLNRKKYYDHFEKKVSDLPQQTSSPHIQNQRSSRKLSLADDRYPTNLNESLSTEKNHKNRLCSSTCKNIPECLNHCSHYLDLAGIESYTSKFATYTTNACLSVHECPGEHAQRTNFSRYHKERERKPHCKRKGYGKEPHLFTAEASPHLLRKNKEHRCDILETNFDLSDEAKEKFNWEHHRRSKSHDVHKNDYLRHNSPKLKCHSGEGISSNHYCCRKHKEQEKESQWNKLRKHIEKDFNARCRKENLKFVPTQEKDKCEHHHVHEHIHHHYHHYVDA